MELLGGGRVVAPVSSAPVMTTRRRSPGLSPPPRVAVAASTQSPRSCGRAAGPSPLSRLRLNRCDPRASASRTVLDTSSIEGKRWRQTVPGMPLIESPAQGSWQLRHAAGKEAFAVGDCDSGHSCSAAGTEGDGPTSWHMRLPGTWLIDLHARHSTPTKRRRTHLPALRPLLRESLGLTSPQLADSCGRAVGRKKLVGPADRRGQR